MNVASSGPQPRKCIMVTILARKVRMWSVSHNKHFSDIKVVWAKSIALPLQTEALTNVISCIARSLQSRIRILLPSATEIRMGAAYGVRLGLRFICRGQKKQNESSELRQASYEDAINRGWYADSEYTSIVRIIHLLQITWE